MARTVTLAQLRTRVRELSDTEGDPNITDAELTALANRHLTEVYDALVDAGPPEYFAASTTVTTVAGTTTYALPAGFRTLLEVYANESSTELRPIFPMREGERGRWKPPTGAWTFTVEYIPAAPTLVADSDTFDGVSGWEELIVALRARDVMSKRQQQIGEVAGSSAALQARIQSRARNRDRGHARYIADLDTQGMTTWPWGWTQNIKVGAYRLRAGNLELYEPQWGLP